MNIIQLSDYQRGSYLGTAHFYRFPDGSIRAMVTDMADWEIDAEPTISQRFEKFAGWLRDGAGSLMEQAKEFGCPGEGEGNVNEPAALGVVTSLADRGDTSANPTADDVLKPCPFCGGHAELTGHKAPEFWVICPAIGCKATTEAFGSKTRAIAAWNRRTHPTDSAAKDAETYRLMLLDLLAVIHRDGGHRTQELGIKLSYEQALRISSERVAALANRGEAGSLAKERAE